MKKALLLGGLLAVCGGAARAEFVGVRLGTDAPPDRLGLWTMLPAPFDSRIFADVTSVPGAAGTTITFSQPMNCRQITISWQTWNHDYTGNVYYSNGATSVTIGVLGERLHRGAFSLYAMPHPFGLFTMIATGSDGVSSMTFTEEVDASFGAEGWAFYTISEPWGIEFVTITTDVDFAVGEFATGYIPSPGGLVLAGLMALRPVRQRGGST